MQEPRNKNVSGQGRKAAYRATPLRSANGGGGGASQPVLLGSALSHGPLSPSLTLFAFTFSHA
jgi:hypothetical protein